MPTYQYEDKQTGGVVELTRRIAERDAVPAHLRRITAPQRLTVFGTTSDKLDPGSADAAVPQALKSLTNTEANQMIQSEGKGVDYFKKTWGL